MIPTNIKCKTADHISCEMFNVETSCINNRTRNNRCKPNRLCRNELKCTKDTIMENAVIQLDSGQYKIFGMIITKESQFDCLDLIPIFKMN